MENQLSYEQQNKKLKTLVNLLKTALQQEKDKNKDISEENISLQKQMSIILKQNKQIQFELDQFQQKDKISSKHNPIFENNFKMQSQQAFIKDLQLADMKAMNILSESSQTQFSKFFQQDINKNKPLFKNIIQKQQNLRNNLIIVRKNQDPDPPKQKSRIFEVKLKSKKEQKINNKIMDEPMTIENIQFDSIIQKERTSKLRFTMTNQKKLVEDDEPMIEDFSDFSTVINSVADQQQKIIEIKQEGSPPVTISSLPETQKVPLFDQFFIITADKSECHKFSNIGDTMNLDPTILYTFPAQNLSMSHQTNKIFPKFVFPFGVMVQKIKKTKSLSSINEIIFGQNMYDRYINSFIFAIRNDESYNSSNNEQTLLQLCNPDKLQFCICLSTKDFYDGIEINENEKSKDFFIVHKTYCIVTRFPFINFFLDLISSIIQKIKIIKITAYSQYQEEKEKIAKIDVFFYQEILHEIELMLNTVYNSQTPTAGMVIPFDIQDQQELILRVPEAQDCWCVEAEWTMSQVFNKYTVYEIVLLLCSLLYEDSIVFLSSNRSILTATILILHCMLKPFQWPHPIIFTMSEELLPIFDSPVPILCGLNKDYNFVQENQYETIYPDRVFVNLDQFGIQNQNPSIFKTKFFKELSNSLKPSFDLLKKKSNRSELLYIPTDQENDISKNILNITKNFLINNIVDHLPKEGIKKFINKKSQIDVNSCRSKVIESSFLDNQFINKFVNTQIFTFFVEEYYK